MRKHIFITGMMVTLMLSMPLSSQHRWKNEGGGGDRPERLEKYRLMRLVEKLNLNEEESMRFLGKHNTHETKIRELIMKKDRSIDELEGLLGGKAPEGTIESATEKVRAVDKEIFQERQKFQDEIKNLMTPVQFAKFIAFEREFGRKVRDAIRGMGPEQKPPQEGD